MNSTALSRLTLGVAATAVTSASGAIVVFDIPDTTYDSYLNNGSLSFSAINLESATYQPINFGVSPKFQIGAGYEYFNFQGNPGLSAAQNSFSSVGNIIDANLVFADNRTPDAEDVPNGLVYLGLRLTSGADVHYGWFEFESSPGEFGGQYIFTFTRFAFNDVAGQSILAGQTTAVPEASTLGLVGGLFGLVAAAHVRRRKFKQAAASDKFLALAAGEKLG
jgi:hypothetical protein